MADWRAREVENQTIFREINEWTKDDIVAGVEVDRSYICECSDIECAVPISLTLAEYEAVRGFPARFAIATDHENPEVDSVIVENVGFTTVEKIGEGAGIARATDPRRRS